MIYYTLKGYLEYSDIDNTLACYTDLGKAREDLATIERIDTSGATTYYIEVDLLEATDEEIEAEYKRMYSECSDDGAVDGVNIDYMLEQLHYAPYSYGAVSEV